MEKAKRDPEATKAALIDAAKRLMASCTDPSKVTSRAITREAGVNLAMINYFFGSREALLLEVFNSIKMEFAQNEPVLLSIITSDMSPKDKLIELHFESVRLMLRYYNYTKAIINYVLINRDIASDHSSLAFIMAHFGGRKTEQECRLIAYNISALHQLLVLRHEDVKKSCGIDLMDDDALKKLITDNINRFLD